MAIAGAETGSFAEGPNTPGVPAGTAIGVGYIGKTFEESLVHDRDQADAYGFSTQLEMVIQIQPNQGENPAFDSYILDEAKVPGGVTPGNFPPVYYIDFLSGTFFQGDSGTAFDTFAYSSGSAVPVVFQWWKNPIISIVESGTYSWTVQTTNWPTFWDTQVQLQIVDILTGQAFTVGTFNVSPISGSGPNFTGTFKTSNFIPLTHAWYGQIIINNPPPGNNQTLIYIASRTGF